MTDLFWILVGGIVLFLAFTLFCRAMRLLMTVVNALFDCLERKVNTKFGTKKS